MVFKIVHETTYRYNLPVFFEPHSLRFRPRPTPFLDLKAVDLHISPKPTGLSTHMDAENNWVSLCWFDGMHQQLTCKWELTVDSVDHNPFNFIVYPDTYLQFPFVYPQMDQETLGPAMQKWPISVDIMRYGQDVLKASQGETIAFLVNLTQRIHTSFKLDIRQDGEPYQPDFTFNLKWGACRDLAWMQIQLLRNMGMAARFVSGYLYLPVSGTLFELHAWLEVYIPGAGWIGFDPSHGIICGPNHIAISSSSHYANTMAITGTIRGNAMAEMETSVVITQID